MSADFAQLILAIKAEGAETAKRAAASVRQEMVGLKDAIEKNTKAMEQNGRATKKGAKDTDTAAKSQRDLQKQLTASSGRLKVLGRDINKYLTIPMMAFSGASIKMANNLNKGMGNVSALIAGQTDRVNELKDSVRDMSADTGKNFQDLTDGLYRTISVFQDNADTVSRLNTAVKMGIAGYATTAESVQLLSSVTRAYGDTSAAAVEKVASLSFEAVRLGDTTIPALSGAMQVATDRAVRLGISQEELFATMATLTGITGDASMVATQFRSAMDSLLNPTEALQDLLKKLGYESAEAAIEEEGLLGVLTKIKAAADATGQPLQDFITRKEGITLASRLAGEQMDDFVFKLGEITKNTGAATDAYNEVTGGVNKFGIELGKAKQRLASALSVIGDNFLPMIVDLAHGLALVVEAFSLLPSPIQKSILALTGLVSVLGIYFQISGAIKGMKLAGVFVKTATGAGTATTAVTGLNTALGVTGLLLGGIALVAVAVGVAFAKHQRMIEQSAKDMETRLKNLKGLQEDIMNSGVNDNAYNAMKAAYTSKYTAAGAVPIFTSDMSGRTGALNSGQTMTIKEMSTDEIKAQMAQYEREMQTLRENFIDVTTEELDKMKIAAHVAIANFQKEFVTPHEGVEGGFEKFLAETFIIATPSEMADIKTKFSDEVKDFEALYDLTSEQLANALDYKMKADKGGMLYGPELEEAIENLRNLKDKLKTVMDNKLNWEMAEGENATYMQQLADIEGAYEALSLAEKGVFTAPDPDKDKMKTWQEWFAAITDVDSVVKGMSGIDAAKEYAKSMEDAFNLELDLSAALGLTPDKQALVEDQLGKIEDDIRELLTGVPFDEIDDPFKLTDYLMQADPGLVNQYKEEVSKLAGTVADTLAESWNKADAAGQEFNKTIEANGLRLEKTELTYDELADRLAIVQEEMDRMKLLNKDIDFNDEGFRKLLELYDELIAKMKEMKPAYQEAMEQVKDFGQASREATYDWIADKLQPETVQTWAAAIAVGVDQLFNLAGALGDSLMAGFEDFGKALSETGDFAAAFDEALTSMVDSIINALPTLLLNAGIQLLGTPAWPLGLALIASSAGAAMLKGFWNAEKSAAEEGTSTDAFASGGVINTPVTFSNAGRRSLAGEAGWEGILPLTRNANGELGVKAQSGGDTEVNISIQNYAGVEVEQSTDANGNIEIILKKTLKGMVAKGTLDKEMRGRYGLRAGY